MSLSDVMEERIYTINLRRGVMTSPRWKKSDDSVSFIRNFLKRHMKSQDIIIDNAVSKEIWKHGNQRPLRKIRIKAVKDDENKVTASLFGTASVVIEESKSEKIEEKKK